MKISKETRKRRTLCKCKKEKVVERISEIMKYYGAFKDPSFRKTCARQIYNAIKREKL